MIRKILNFAEYGFMKIRDLMPMAVFMVCYMLCFTLLEKRTSVHYTEIHAWVDDRIPFSEIFVIPYMLWFAFVAAVVLYLYFKDRDRYDRTATLLYIGMTVFIVISYAFPNIQYLRPYAFAKHDFLTGAVRWLYRTDTNTNVFPSIHVYNTLCCMAGMKHSGSAFAKRPAVRAFVTALGYSIILSVMFLKQHSVVDVIGAYALFLPVYILVFRYDLVLTAKGNRTLYE